MTTSLQVVLSGLFGAVEVAFGLLLHKLIWKKTANKQLQTVLGTGVPLVLAVLIAIWLTQYYLLFGAMFGALVCLTIFETRAEKNPEVV